MREQVERRLSDLEAELRAGQQMLADLEAKRADVQQTLLRISGAIQVLTELLDTGSGPASDGAEGNPAASGAEQAQPAAPASRAA